MGYEVANKVLELDSLRVMRMAGKWSEAAGIGEIDQFVLDRE